MYKTKDFDKHEFFRIGIDGVTLMRTNEPTNQFSMAESPIISQGTHSLDIAILSDFQTYDPNFESKARVLINRLTILGSIEGGASECMKCPLGFINTGKNSYCEMCPPGHQPNEERTACVKCPEGEFNPTLGSMCTKCIPFTHPNEMATKCVPHDVIRDAASNM